MRQTIMSIALMVLAAPIFSQNLMLEVFSGANITAYDTETLNGNATYYPIGFRIAGGLPNVQLGGEYHTDLKSASFEQDVLGVKVTDEFSNSYYGGFIRANISPNPAYAFGVVIKAGVGIYDVKQTISGEAPAPVELDFDGQLGFNGGLGFSIPIAEKLHLEAGYVFNYLKREFDSPAIKDYNAFHHSFQVGFSYNFLFGESARRYDSNKRWKNGWRGAAGQRYKNWKG